MKSDRPAVRALTAFGAICLALSAAAVPVLAKPSPAPDPGNVDAAALAGLAELVDFIRLPNVTSRSSAEIRKNADWLEAALRRRGWVARQLADGETPMVMASYPAAQPTAPTVLFYAHMDGQPVDPKEWNQPDPFVPVLRSCSAPTVCDDVPLDRLTSGAIDPDWRIFARSAADDKGPILMLMAAVARLEASGKKPAINIKLIVDSHEEGGPPTLGDVVRANKEALAADAIVVLDGPMHPSNSPTVVFGHRGGGVLQIVIHGPRQAMHSGHYGNYLPNPAQNLARLLAGMKDDSGRVLIPGYYEGATPAFVRATREIPVGDDEAALLRTAGVAAHESFVSNYRASISMPSLNLIGLAAGSGAALDRSIVPASATASFDLRTVPGISFERELDLVRKWVVGQGYHLVDKDPTDAERQRYPRIASITGRPLSEAMFTDPQSPTGRWIVQAVRGSRVQPIVAIPIMGGSVPTEALIRELHAPLVLLPLVNADNNQHAANENLRVGNFMAGIRHLAALLGTRP